MSIATDEAEKYFPTQYWPNMEPKGDYPGKECYIDGVKSSDIQEAYEMGRTAKPTESEIKAAVRAMYYRHAADWESDEDYACHLLEAARKAVME